MLLHHHIIVEELQGHWSAWFAGEPQKGFSGSDSTDAIFRLLEAYELELTPDDLTEIPGVGRPDHLEFWLPKHQNSLADRFLSAIESSDLETRLVTLANSCSIEVLIEGQTVADVGCSRMERPRATTDRMLVIVVPSPDHRGGFDVECETTEDAMLIAEILDGYLEGAFLDLVDPDR